MLVCVADCPVTLSVQVVTALALDCDMVEATKRITSVDTLLDELLEELELELLELELELLEELDEDELGLLEELELGLEELEIAVLDEMPVLLEDEFVSGTPESLLDESKLPVPASTAITITTQVTSSATAMILDLSSPHTRTFEKLGFEGLL